MHDYDERQKSDQWRTSQGKMTERTPEQQRDGEHHLTGYRSSEEERHNKSAPKEMAKLSGTFGDMAVGVDKERKLSITISERRTQQNRTTNENQKVVGSEGAKKMYGTRGRGFTNLKDPKESAVLFRDEGTRPPYFIKRRFQGMMKSREQELLDQQVPFLDQSREHREEKALLQQEKEVRKQGDDSKELAQITTRRSELQQTMTEKSRQERRFQQTIKQAQERAAAETVKPWETLDTHHDSEPPQGENEEPPAEPEEENLASNIKDFLEDL